MMATRKNSPFNRLRRLLVVSTVLTLATFASTMTAHASSVSETISQWVRPLAQPIVHRYRLWQHDIRYDDQVRIPVDGRSPLQASLYLPDRTSQSNAPLATILVMLPYGRHQYGEALRAGVKFGAAGFAVLTLDLRGYESDSMANAQTRSVPWAGVTLDASAVLDWIVQQPWSNGRVGTFGCSALGETQFALAKANHPAHRAMLVSGAGGALGHLQGRYGYFGLFEGGVFQLASGYGWLARRGWLQPPYVRDSYSQADNPQAVLQSLARLPLKNQVNHTFNAWGFITSTPLDDPAWRALNYVHDDDTINVPTLTINTWADQTLSESIALHHHISAPGKSMVLAPGDHCNHERTASPGGADWQAVYNQWFDRWLRPDQDDGNRNIKGELLPPVSFRLPGDTQWRHADNWPPQASVATSWTLQSATSANSVSGDGQLLPVLSTQTLDASSKPHSEWEADPANPVPSVGGPVCCTSTPTIVSGRHDQQSVEQREDVLIFTTESFTEATEFAGPVQARLFLSSDAADADLIVRITDVAPNGRSINIQEGAQRVSMTEPDASARLSAGDVVPVTVNVRDLAYRFLRGHRLRMHIAASSFPRLARNLQTGGFNRSNDQSFTGRHRLHHSSQYPSTITLRKLTDSDTGR